MDHAGVVRSRERAGNVERDIERTRGRKRPAGDLLPERAAGNVLRDEQELAVDVFQRVDDGHAGMGDRGSRLGLAPQPLAQRAVGRHGRRQHLERDAPPEALILGEVHDAHAPAAEFLENRVRTNDGTRCNGFTWFTWFKGFIEIDHRRLFEESSSRFVRLEQCLRLAEHFIVRSGFTRQPRAAGGRRLLERSVEERLETLPLRGIHSSARFNHARAIAHWRLTVAGDTPTASAVSSTVSPPK